MTQSVHTGRSLRDEFPTLALLILCYLGFGAASGFGALMGPFATVLILSLIIALYSSLQHEMLHGHPFRNQLCNDLLVFPALGIFIPYHKFKDTHLAHHFDPNLTDPYDDPESNFQDPLTWLRLSVVVRYLYEFNNTLAGRMIIGPAIGLGHFYAQDLRFVMRGQKRVQSAYLQHGLGLLVVGAWWGTYATAPVWTLVSAAYCGMSILKIRTFLEHRAHERAACRTVIIEDRGPLSILFLNNNFHSVHHAHPKIVWHRLPRVFDARRDEFLRRNDAYYYKSYSEIFLLYLLRVKDPVAHPLMRAPIIDTMAATDISVAKDSAEKELVDAGKLADV